MKRSLICALALATLALAACVPAEDSTSAGFKERAIVAENQNTLLSATPLPVLRQSQERQNLAKRLQRINAQNMSGCVYLISQGTVMSFYPVRGKVSSLNSYLTGPDKLVNDPNGDLSAGSVLMEQPDLDGAYGDNAQGIFFFTADTDTYVEWKGDYLFSDSCLALAQQPKLVRSTK